MKKKYFIPLTFLIGFLFIQVIHAQEIYTNPDPDITYSFTSSLDTTTYYQFDLNNDTISDLEFVFYKTSSVLSVWVTPLNNTEFVFKSYWADTLNFNDTIGLGCQWSSSSCSMTKNEYSSGYGLWAWAKNNFLGTRLILNNDTIYGWIRIDTYNNTNPVNNNITLWIRDYAFSTTSSQFILAGSCCIPPIAENVAISDISNYHNGKDIKVKFNKALDETKIDEYRIIVVKESEATSFNIDSAKNVILGNYISVFPSGLNYSDTLPTNAKDKNGDIIQELIPYKVFVLTVVDTAAIVQDELSLPSNTLTLYSPAAAVTNVIVSKAYQGGTSYQINVSFNKVADESVISSYRVIFVKSTSSIAFSLDSATTVSVNGYYSLAPTGNNLQISFNSDTTRDNSTQLIPHLVNYKVFVLSYTDGISGNVNALSVSSGSFNLSSSAVAVTSVIAEDVSDYGNSNDLHISFNKVPDESKIAGYRIIGVKLTESLSFNLSSVNNVLPENSLQISCIGSDIDTILPVDTKDKNGDLILQNIPYRFYIVTIADSIHTDLSSLKYSNIVKLQTLLDYFKAGLDTGFGVHYINIEPDVYLSNGNYNLDLNSDGTVDFQIYKEYIYSGHWEWGNSYIVPFNNNEVAVINLGTIDPDTLQFNYMINNDIFWNDTICNLFRFDYLQMPPFSHSSSGIWGNINDKYMGLRIISINDTIYGWIRLDSRENHILLKDYAWYLPTTNIETIDLTYGFCIYPNPANNEFNIKLYSKVGRENTIKITNCLGKEVYSKLMIQNNEIIDVSDWAKGMYMLKVNTFEGIKTAKFIVQ